MNSKGGKNKGLLGLFISVQAVLIILKVLGEISVSWWLVLIPFLGMVINRGCLFNSYGNTSYGVSIFR